MIKNNLNLIINNIKNFEKNLNKKISLLAVSKTKTNEDILNIYNKGIKEFGENYVEEIIEKYNNLPKDIKWHFIGHLQSNKVSKLMKIKLESIQSIDSIKLLKKVNKQAKELNIVQKIYLQIKMSNEDTKFGININEIENHIDYCMKECSNINLIGFMMIGKSGDYDSFKDFDNLRNKMNSKYNKEYKISMGMSKDYEIAIKNNSDLVRIGSLIFGNRDYNK